MRFHVFLLALCLLSTAHAEQPSSSTSISSENFGFGPGIVMQEISSDAEHSVFKIFRNYEYKDSPSAAWGSAHNFFVYCALRKVGIQRDATKVRVTFETMEDAKLRPMRDDEPYAAIGPEQLFLQADWLSGDIGDAAALLKEHIIPFTEYMAKSCEGFKSKTGLH